MVTWRAEHHIALHGVQEERACGLLSVLFRPDILFACCSAWCRVLDRTSFELFCTEECFRHHVYILLAAVFPSLCFCCAYSH